MSYGYPSHSFGFQFSEPRFHMYRYKALSTLKSSQILMRNASGPSAGRVYASSNSPANLIKKDKESIQEPVLNLRLMKYPKKIRITIITRNLNISNLCLTPIPSKEK